MVFCSYISITSGSKKSLTMFITGENNIIPLWLVILTNDNFIYWFIHRTNVLVLKVRVNLTIEVIYSSRSFNRRVITQHYDFHIVPQICPSVSSRKYRTLSVLLICDFDSSSTLPRLLGPIVYSLCRQCK